ncbi:VWA domain-containing protein [Nitriliruptoraceae bacterium ZYF776]|nr:VWA domain-containing protein [Profundirhabdus halotolerans]
MSGDLTGSVVGFARTLRAAGVPATPDRVHACVAALAELGASRRRDVYWAGRLTLCAGPDDLDRYDRVFATFFAGESVRSRPAPRRRVRLGADAVGHDVGTADPDDGPAPELSAVTRNASREELLRHRDVAELTDRERAELHRLLTALAMPGETRRTRRRVPGARGHVDRRRTVRAVLATGELAGLHRRVPREVPRRVVLLVDVSGSMAGYADTLLRFAHVAVRRHGPRTEVFTIGTRLTRVTVAMGHRDPDLAMRAVGAAIPDWSGGTRLGDGLQRFLDLWGQRGLARGAIVVVLSDGWETGDPSHLGEQTARLSRLARRVVWANPRAGRAGFAPTAAGMAAALPHCDALVEGHSLAALEHLGAVVSGAVVAGPRGPAGRSTTGTVTARPPRRTVDAGGGRDA